MNTPKTKESLPNSDVGTRAPAHEIVYHQLRDLILFGEIIPGQAVTIQGLTDRLNAGMTPVREAIRRLISEGALVFQGNRRVSVPTLTEANVNELIFARAAIEPQLILIAAKKITAAQISELVKIDDQLDASITRGDVNAYLRHNFEFHKRLYEIADAPILSGLANSMWLRFGPSLRVVCGRMGTQNLPDQHKETLDAMRKGDFDRAAQAIRDDVIQGMEQVRMAISKSNGNL